MYEKYYGLCRRPFDLSPDPQFFFPTPSHNEALANLNYGVMQKKGFIVVTGEAGTGKTLLLRHLLEFVGRKNVACAFVYNPRLSIEEFLSYVLADLKLSFVGRTKGEMLSYLNDYLLTRSRRGAITALVVDEAHLLSFELLEEIRLLTNLETAQYKLLQLVLVGQSELDEKLDSPELRQLKQRISLRCQLRPLVFEETRGYIHRRLQLAGANSHATTIFPDETIAMIYDLSLGIPRIINNLCENSLIAGFGKQTKKVPVELVQEVASDLRLNSRLSTSMESQQIADKEPVIALASAAGAGADTNTQLDPRIEKQ